ncbi:4'-phosphopantetheinyl transferase family protein [Streptomyces sp. BI20]|uniref:4'-phosphopantetheinyl transferase family protein n=1 Tax=Streptomyces sp. BI20 TaxID=3403460 RepID=UPI003C77632A
MPAPARGPHPPAALPPVGLVWAGSTGAVLAEAGPDPWSLLTGVERARAEGFRADADRADFLAAHVLVRLCAGRLLGLPAGALTLVQSCGSCPRPHGRPRLVEAPGLGVSLAHTRGRVAAVAAPGPVGVDVEELAGPAPDPRLVARACTREERAAWTAAGGSREVFLRQWVRKEALVKAGAGSLDEAARIDVPVHGRGPARWRGRRLTDWTRAGAVGCAATAGPVRLRLLDPDPP